MAKRFTDTNKYKKPFVRCLPGAYKLLWDFLYHDCDHSGIWIVDFEIAQSYIGKDMPINREKAIELFNLDEVRIVEIDNGKKWFIPSFIEFQYGQLSEKNRAHVSVISQLKKLGLIDVNLQLIKNNKEHTSPLQGAKEMEQEKEKDKEMEEEKKGVQGETDTPPVANVPRDTMEIFPGQLVWCDDIYREGLFRLARSHGVSDLENLLDKWEGWYVNKFEWRKKTLREMRVSFESWVKDPKSRIQNGISSNKKTNVKNPTATTFGDW